MDSQISDRDLIWQTRVDVAAIKTTLENMKAHETKKAATISTLVSAGVTGALTLGLKMWGSG